MYSPCLTFLQDANCDTSQFTEPENDISQWSECSEDEDNADFTDEKLTLNSTVLKLLTKCMQVHTSLKHREKVQI